MARIPIQSLVSPRETGVVFQPGAFQESAKATANLLSAVSGGVDMVKKHFDRAQDLENNVSISEKKRLIRNSQGEFLNKMTEENVPPSQWGGLWKTELESVKGKLKLEDAPPVVVRAVGEDFENFAGTSLIQIAGEGLKLNQRLARQNLDRDLSFYAQTGDREAESKAIDSAVEGNVIPPELGEDYKRGAALRYKEEDIETNRIKNPVEHKKALSENKYSQSPNALAKEKEATDRQIQKYETTQMGLIGDDIEAGFYEDLDQLNSDLDSEQNKYISDANKEKIRKNYKSTIQITPFENYEFEKRIQTNLDKLYTPNNGYGPDEYADEWNKISADQSALGGRKGAGAIYSDLNNVRPSLHSQERLDALAEKGSIAAGKPFKTMAYNYVSKHVSGMAGIEYDKNKVDFDVADEGFSSESDAALHNKQLKQETNDWEYLVQDEMQRELDEWYSSFPAGTQVDGTMVLDWIKANEKQIATKAFDKLTKKPFGAIPESSETLRDAWGVPGTLLPVQGSMPKGD